MTSFKNKNIFENDQFLKIKIYLKVTRFADMVAFT